MDQDNWLEKRRGMDKTICDRFFISIEAEGVMGWGGTEKSLSLAPPLQARA